ncbi:MAG: glycosyltransferase family 2 protein [Myxococcota bacterium]|jgi:glycosyltransferase involved in cell wall biosynthesis|nr:glycosyltransferase family 2 protein [Myxococcota bacterium]
MKVAALIPVYNNAGTIADVVRRTRTTMGDDLLVVVDGATDDSEALAQQAGAKTFALPMNRGKGAALRAGFLALAQRGYTHAAVLDADGQHLPEQLPGLIEAASACPDAICIGVRRLAGPDVPPSSRRGRAISNFFATLNSWQTIKDAQSGMRVYPLAKVLALPCEEARFAYEMEVLVRASWAGMTLVHADIDVHYPKENRVSHFDMWSDNLAFSWLSFRLFWGMVARIPMLAWRRLRALG